MIIIIILLRDDVVADVAGVKTRRHVIVYAHATWRTCICVCAYARVCARMHVCVRAHVCVCY